MAKKIMAKFKDKSGHVCEVYSLDNIEKFRNNNNYTEILDNKAETKTKKSKPSKSLELGKEEQESDV